MTPEAEPTDLFDLIGSGDDATEQSEEPPAPAQPADVEQPSTPETPARESFTFTAGVHYVPSGPKARFRANIRAIELSQQLDAEQRPATPQEQEELAAWSGWGAIPDVFADHRPGWEEERAELKALLTDEEYEAADASILNAFYTPPALSSAIWDGLADLGFDGGDVLEPGCGSGIFMATAPEGASVTGIELDPITARIARHLNPQADVRNESFYDTRLPAHGYDAVIGNVPFGETRRPDAEWNKELRFNLHEYFIRKGIAGLHPGGVMAVVTSTATSDKRSPVLRAEVATEADFLGAVRLPGGAFRRQAGTDVATDILVFRKRLPGEEITQQTRDWQTTSERDFGDGTAHRVNNYFLKNPERVLGAMGTSGQWGRLSVTNENYDPLSAGPVRTALEGIVEEAKAQGRTYVPLTDAQRTEREQAAERPSATEPPGTIVDLGDAKTAAFHVVTPTGDYRPLKKPAKKYRDEVHSLMRMRDVLTDLVAEDGSSVTETAQSRSLRAEARSLWEAHVEKYGPINRFETKWRDRQVTNPETGKKETVRTSVKVMNPAFVGMRRDPRFSLVAGVERFNEESQQAQPADILLKRTVSAYRPKLGADTAEEALGLTIGATGTADLEQIALRLGVDTETARAELGDLVFDDPNDPETIITRAEYLSGHVRNKLAEARAALERDPEGPWQRNIDALNSVMPEDVPVEDIEAIIGAVWIDQETHEKFLRELTDDDYVTVINAGYGYWDVKNATKRSSVKSSEQWGTPERPADQLFRSMLTGTSIVVKDKVMVEPGKYEEVLNVEKTEAARDKAQQIQDRFAEWVWEHPGRAVELHAEYNARFNSYVARDYTEEAQRLTLPGLVDDFTPHPHQLTAVARMIAEPAVGLFHQVGAGKTSAMVMGLTELKRRGLVQKPAVVVPNHMLEQFTREWKQLYPGAQILSAGSEMIGDSSSSGKPENVEQRRTFIAQAAMNDWDAIILTESAFGKIGVREETRKTYMKKEIETLREALKAAHGIEGSTEGRTRTQKNIRAAIDRAEGVLEAKTNKDADNGLSWEDTGVDYLAVDEAHGWKNLRTVSNIADAAVTGSDKATDLHMKLDWMRETYGARVATLATGTPVANSITEAHVMMRYLRPDLLEETGVAHFDDWANTFGRRVARWERTPDGNLKNRERFAKFKNVPEMLGGWQQFADVKMSDDLELNDMPQIALDEDGERRPLIEVVPESLTHSKYRDKLGKRLQSLTGRPQRGEDNHLKVYGDGRKAALDPALVGQPTTETVKLDRAAANIAAIWGSTKDLTYTVPGSDEISDKPGALQLVFSDLGVPNGEGWNAYDALKQRLVEEYGMDPGRVRFIHEARNDEEKAVIFKQAREGDIDVLIGSSSRMGTGANIQDRAIALHHLDCPWRPADLTQREGRILRQGNQNPEVDIIRYVTENSFDSTSWDIIARKGYAIAQLMRSTIDVRELEDPGDEVIDAQQLMAASSGDPLMLERVEAEDEVNRLERLERGHKRSQNAMKSRLLVEQTRHQHLSENLPKLEAVVGNNVETKGDKFSLELNGQTYTSRKEANEAMLTAIKRASGADASSTFVRPTSHRPPLVKVGGQYFQIVTNGGHRSEAQVQFRMVGAEKVTPASATFEWSALMSPQPPRISTTLEHRVAALPGLVREYKAYLEDSTAKVNEAKAMESAPFKYAGELREARRTLDRILAQIKKNELTPGAAQPSAEKQPEGKAPREVTRSRYAAATSARERAFGVKGGYRKPKRPAETVAGRRRLEAERVVADSRRDNERSR